MNDEQRMVIEFHRAFDIAIGTLPAIPDEATCTLRISLIQEEFDELRQALAQRDVAEVAKELADLLYVVYGTAVSCGLDMAPVFHEVHRSNMSKVGGHKRADGKWIKPPHYSPAQLHSMLAAQGAQVPPLSEPHQNAGMPTPRAPAAPVFHANPLPIPTTDERPASSSGGSAWGGARLAPRSGSETWPRGQPARQDEPRRRAPRLRPCARCGKSFIQRSHRRGVQERLLSLIYIYPFRCQICGYRFKAWQFRVRYTKKLIDRRQYGRLPTHVPTTFAESVKPGEYRVGDGVVTDISVGGCYLRTAARLLEGSLVSLELQTVAHAPAIAVEAAIVRSVRPTGVGLEFLRLQEAEHERLSQFIRQLLAQQRMGGEETESP